MKFYIYKSVRKSTGEYYIGKRCFKGDIQKDKYMGSGFLFRRKYNKDPSDWDKEILKVCRNRVDLSIAERSIVGDLWETDSKCLNLKPGGEGGRTPGQVIGDKHHTYDPRVFTFYLYGEEKFTGTRFEWQEHSGLKSRVMRMVVNGERFSSKGWSILKDRPMKVCSFCGESADPRVFRFHDACEDYYNNFIYRRNTYE